jgi:bla regulator protein BlaR1
VALDQVIRILVEGAVLAIVVGVICAAFPRIRASHRALMWWLVSAKLLLGLAPIPALTIEALPAPKEIGAPVASAFADVQRAVTRHDEPLPLVSKGTVARWAWIGAASLLFVAMVPGWVRVRGLVQRGRPIDDGAIPETIARAARSAGLHRIPRVLAVPGLDTPLVTGLFRPAILLPVRSPERIDLAELEMTLAHEMAHIARGDLWLGLVPMLARQIFFFHPAAWIAEREHAVAREAACDEIVLGRAGADAFAYGCLLVASATRRRAAVALPMSPQSMLRRRLVMIDSMLRRVPLGRAGWALVAVVALGMVPVRILAKEASGSRCLDIGSGKDSAYVITDGNSHSMCGDTDDVVTAIKARGNGGDVVWFRVDGQDWIVRDPSTVAEAQRLFHTVGEIGERQGAIGARQGEIGAQQSKIGMEQGAIGMRQAEVALAQAGVDLTRANQQRMKEQLAPEVDKEARERVEKEIAEREARLEQLKQANHDVHSEEDIKQRMSELSVRMQVLSRQQQALSDQQRVLSEHMSREIAEAQRALTELLERTMRNGTAIRAD